MVVGPDVEHDGQDPEAHRERGIWMGTGRRSGRGAEAVGTDLFGLIPAPSVYRAALLVEIYHDRTDSKGDMVSSELKAQPVLLLRTAGYQLLGTSHPIVPRA